MWLRYSGEEMLSADEYEHLEALTGLYIDFQDSVVFLDMIMLPLLNGNTDVLVETYLFVKIPFLPIG